MGGFKKLLGLFFLIDFNVTVYESWMHSQELYYNFPEIHSLLKFPTLLCK